MTARYHNRMYFLPTPELAAHLLHVPQGSDLALEVHGRDVQAFDQVLGRCTAGLLQDFQNFPLTFGQLEFSAEILAKGLGAVHRPRVASLGRRQRVHVTVLAECPAEVLPLFPLQQ